MALGYSSGGVSGFGPSRMFESLPFKGWREVATWVEEFIDACGWRFDVLNNRFISAAARASLLDPTTPPTDSATNYLATATEAPILATSSDTMLDVLLYITLGLSPADSNLSVAQKQALVQAGWEALQRKGTRLRLLDLASKISDGIDVGWTVPPNNFSIILPDGAPDPGYGNWVQAASTTSGVIRPWALSAIRQTVAPGTPAFANLGVGYSQFRAGYSAAGETVFPSGCRINILAHEHFDSWSAGVPVGWSKVGTATLTQSTIADSINWEFTGNAAVLDLTGRPASIFVGLSQSAANINNQVTHRFQLDYAYSNSQEVDVLVVQITDVNRNGTTYYWDPDIEEWSATEVNITVPMSTTRNRYACDIIPQASSTSTSVQGTTGLTVTVKAISDGTPTTQTTYTIYRVGLYEKFDLDEESDAAGERTLWLPLKDAMGWTTSSRSAGGTLLEPANAARTAYKTVGATSVSQPYHAALSDRGFRAHGSWTNLIAGSNDFGADWTRTNANRTANGSISPIVGETVASAVVLTATNTSAKIVQATGSTATSKTYVGGVWVKKLSTDGNFTDVTVSLVSTSTKSQSFTLTQAQGWQLLPINMTFGASDLAVATFQIAWGAASTNGQIAVASAYLYDVTTAPGVLYPPVIQTSIGSTATLAGTVCTAVTSGANVLHPLTQRTLVSVVRGALSLTLVPTFDALSQLGITNIFDVGQGAAQNRVALRMAGGIPTLQLVRWDNAGNVWQAFLTLTTDPNPAAGYMTWRRDTPITVRCIWDENTTSLSAGNGSAIGVKPGSWAPSDTSVATIGIGNDIASANRFEGIITNIECVLNGAPIS